MNHIDQEAELYALGMLEDDERARVDEHLAACDECLRRVGEAEGAVASLVEGTQRVTQPRTPRWPLAIAAAFAVSTAGVLGQNFLMRGQLAGDGAIMAQMVNSHFDHAQFASPQGEPIGAKAVYERHGKWYQILADGEPNWRVVLVQPDGTRDPSAAGFARRGTSSVMTVRPDTPVKTIELDDTAGHVVGVVHPVLAPDGH